MFDPARDQAACCKGKVRHRSPERAWRVVRRMQRARDLGEKLDVYRCPFCKGWHLGSKRRSLR